MDSLFGIPMTTIMYVLLAVFGLSIASVGYIFVRNRVMFKMGLRNLPRRGLQTGLIVVGLMLATLIIAASFTTGDTIDHSLTARAYDHWQRTDLIVNIRGDQSEDLIGPEIYVPEGAAAQLTERFAGDPDIELFVPFLFQKGAATSNRTQLSEPNVNFVGIVAESMEQSGGIRLTNGERFDLATLERSDVLISERTAEELDARTGDTLGLYIDGRQFEATIAGVVKDEQATGAVGDFDDLNRPGGIVLPLASLQMRSGHDGFINYIGVTLKGDVRSTLAGAEGAGERVESFINTADGQAILGLGDRHIGVETVKLDDVDEAEEFGNLFTSFFMVIGLFSIAAGIMLIFMIFVMLAAERKPEMGMARAVGAQRSNLVQSFVAEGMSYNLIAGAVGAALGIGAAVLLIVGYLRYSLGDDFDFISANISLTSLVVSYCLGVVLTFVTVVFASIKVSGVNIVSAIRGTPEDETPEVRKISWKWVVIGVPALIIPPLGLWFILRKGLNVAWTWILAPTGILIAILLIAAANSGGSEALFSLGFSLLPLCAAAIASKLRAPARVTWTAVGAFLAAYWLSPWPLGEEILGRELTGDIEMFPVSGIMVVIGFTLMIVWNARLLTLLFKGENGTRYHVPLAAAAASASAVAGGVAMGDSSDGLGQLLFVVAGLLALTAGFAFAAVRFPRLGPALKMGVAYPLANRFRTGMTIAMFSLIVFSLTVFSAVNANFTAMITGEDGDGGYQIVATSNAGADEQSVVEALTEAKADVAGDITGAARVTLPNGLQEIQLSGSEAWQSYPVLAADDAFFSAETKLDSRANNFQSDEAALEAVRTDPTLAIVDVSVIEGFNDQEVTIDFGAEDGEFDPYTINVRNATTGQQQTLTIVGVWANRLISTYTAGLYLNAEAYKGLFGEPDYARTYIQLADGTDAEDAARDVEASLGTLGVQADSTGKLIEDDAAQQRAFTRMFQAFMALGLVVGIAALGVIAFRSVVERRQQIGMLRAIGYQTETVALTFVLESSFIAMMGILSGVVGGVIVSRNLFTTGQFSGDGIEFSMPWGEVLVFVAIAFAVSLAMTWLPSRSAARVPVADALRYE